MAFEESFLFVTGSLQYFVSCIYKQVIKQSHSLLSCDTKGTRELQSCHLLQGHTCTCFLNTSEILMVSVRFIRSSLFFVSNLNLSVKH